MKLKNWFLFLLCTTLISLSSLSQSPQHVTVNGDEEKSLWDTEYGVIIVVAVLLVLFLTRNWSKRIHKKRDQVIEEKQKEEEEKKS